MSSLFMKFGGLFFTKNYVFLQGFTHEIIVHFYKKINAIKSNVSGKTYFTTF